MRHSAFHFRTSYLSDADERATTRQRNGITTKSLEGVPMARLPLRSLEDAPEAARPALETAQKNNGYLPNLLRVLANAPVALETYLTVSGINARASLNLAQREVVQITAAATH